MMRTFAHRYDQAQQQTSATTAIPAARGQLAHPIEAGAHAFSRVAVFPQAAGTIQTRLAVNAPGDRFEQEAERAADRVMGGRESGHNPSLPRSDSLGESLQMHRFQAQDAGAAVVPPLVEEVIASSGQPLDTATRGLMEARFGHDFGNVRVHTNARANESARQIAALAYTSGQHIVFGAGHYTPATASGRRLLAHELAHVVQQTSGGPGSSISRSIQRQPDPASGTGSHTLPPLGSTDLRENASPLLASAMGSTTVDSFALGSATIPKAGEDSLRYTARQILFFIGKYPRSTVHITGHTDRVGTDERNIDLGQQRADAVSAFLQQEGVPPEIISTASKGESDPALPTKNDQPEPRNRRVNVLFRVERSTFSFGSDLSLKQPSLEKVPPTTVPTIPKLPTDFLDKPRIPYRDPEETDWWRRMEEDRQKIEEFDRTHPRENKSLGQAAIDLVMDDVINPILKKLPLPDNLRKKAKEGIRKGLETGSEKACEAAIDQLNIGSTEKDALKAACKATLKQKPGGSKP